ncbi:PTS sugar transporter subunit IIB [Helicovermis profundi]|uniref:Lactose/cellobiose PTS transporter subunit IIB n=1 Tax=Helicovermis profundi TaxID=3065157 RepID=A0AAU9E528_9FIRM|nr:lactose/cellobiose PTS transporter subunit IIB [Clostridia bacterium S502]
MKKIMLVCSAGMSTSLLVKKMQVAALDQGKQVEIFAIAESEVKNHTDVNAVLLGPQVRFLLGKITDMLAKNSIPVEVIGSVNYGTMNGDAVLKQAYEIMKE